MAVQGKQRVAAFEGVGADQEVRQKASRADLTLFPSAGAIPAEGPTGRAPRRLIQDPVNLDSGLSKEPVQEHFVAAGCCHQLRENDGCSNQSPTLEGFVQG